MTLRIVVGEETTKVSKTAAEQALLAHPEFPNDADYTISEANGRWVAAFVESSQDSTEPEIEDETQKEAASNEGSECEDESSDEEKTAAGPAEGDVPVDAGAPMDEPAPEPDDAEEDSKDETAGIKADLEHLTKAVNKIVDALGLNDKPKDDAPIPDAPSDAPPAPPGGSTLTNGKGQAIPKQKAIPQGALLKPGVSPPAFASVSEDHPWREQIEARAEYFEVEEPIGADEKLSSLVDELDELTANTGYHVASISDRTEDGVRLASVTIVADDSDPDNEDSEDESNQ